MLGPASSAIAKLCSMSWKRSWHWAWDKKNWNKPRAILARKLQRKRRLTKKKPKQIKSKHPTRDLICHGAFLLLVLYIIASKETFLYICTWLGVIMIGVFIVALVENVKSAVEEKRPRDG